MLSQKWHPKQFIDFRTLKRKKTLDILSLFPLFSIQGILGTWKFEVSKLVLFLRLCITNSPSNEFMQSHVISHDSLSLLLVIELLSSPEVNIPKFSENNAANICTIKLKSIRINMSTAPITIYWYHWNITSSNMPIILQASKIFPSILYNNLYHISFEFPWVPYYHVTDLSLLLSSITKFISPSVGFCSRVAVAVIFLLKLKLSVSKVLFQNFEFDL